MANIDKPTRQRKLKPAGSYNVNPPSQQAEQEGKIDDIYGRWQKDYDEYDEPLDQAHADIKILFGDFHTLQAERDWAADALPPIPSTAQRSHGELDLNGTIQLDDAIRWLVAERDRYAGALGEIRDFKHNEGYGSKADILLQRAKAIARTALTDQPDSKEEG